MRAPQGWWWGHGSRHPPSQLVRGRNGITLWRAISGNHPNDCKVTFRLKIPLLGIHPTVLCMNQMIYWQGYSWRHYRSSEDWKQVSIALWDTAERMRTVSRLGVGWAPGPINWKKQGAQLYSADTFGKDRDIRLYVFNSLVFTSGNTERKSKILIKNGYL